MVSIRSTHQTLYFFFKKPFNSSIVKLYNYYLKQKINQLINSQSIKKYVNNVSIMIFIEIMDILFGLLHSYSPRGC